MDNWNLCPFCNRPMDPIRNAFVDHRPAQGTTQNAFISLLAPEVAEKAFATTAGTQARNRKRIPEEDHVVWRNELIPSHKGLVKALRCQPVNCGVNHG